MTAQPSPFAVLPEEKRRFAQHAQVTGPASHLRGIVECIVLAVGKRHRFFTVQRSHDSFSSRRNFSYSSQVGKQRGLGPGGSDSRNSKAEANCLCGFSAKTTITSTLAPSGNLGSVTSTR